MCNLMAPKKNRKSIEEFVVVEPTQTPYVPPETNMKE
jgi:hypothetical protein